MTKIFSGQKIIVVGGTSGIGKAIAQSVLRDGGEAVLIGSRQSKLTDAINELSLFGFFTFGNVNNHR